MIAFGTVNNGNSIALRKLIAIGFLALLLSAVFELFTGAPLEAQEYQPKDILRPVRREETAVESLAALWPMAYIIFWESSERCL